ncbi:MAG: ATP-binding protein [Thermodesulfobacteriota bacterium]
MHAASTDRCTPRTRLQRAAMGLLLISMVSLTPARCPAQGSETPQVLVLHSYHQGYLWTDMIMEAVSRTIRHARPNVELHIEYMNTKRQPPEKMFTLLRDQYRVTYQNVRIRVIIATDNNALDFLLRYRDSLFPGVPVVFCGINNIHSYRFADDSGYTGVSEDVDLRSTIEVALRLHQGTEKVAVVTDGTETGQINLSLARDVAARFTGIEFLWLDKLTTAGLKEALENLPHDAIVLNLGHFRDPSGRVFSFRESMDFVVDSTRRPVYTAWDFYLTPQVMGGKLLSGRLQGEAAAEIALNILDGEKPSAIPIRDSPTAYFFNYAAMTRFDVDESRLPPGSIVLGRPDTFYSQYRYYLWGTAALILIQSAVIGLLMWNVTRRRQETVARREAEGKYRAIFDNAIEGIFQATFEGRLMNVSPSLAKTLGYETPAEILDTITDTASQLYVDPENRAELIRRLEEEGLVTGFETRFRKKDGSPVWVTVSVRAVRDERTASKYLEGFIMDITSQKIAEIERARLEEQLFQAQKMEAVGRLTGGIAHDFNNILTAIVGYGSLLQFRLPQEDPLRSYVDSILASGERASALTQSLLTFSRRQPLHTRPLSLTAVVRGVENLLNRLIGEDVELRVVMSPAELTVMADSGQLEQVLMNLATNARDAMPNGGTLTIETRPVMLEKGFVEDRLLIRPGSYALISMTDTGTGMDEATREKIFEPFFTTKGVGKGTGLGLSIVYAIVSQHDGYINVYSERNRGTTFKIYLPVAGTLPEQMRTYALDPPPTGDETILVAEDDDEVRKLITDVLEGSGYRVLAASDGEHAVKEFREHRDKVHLLLLDVIMPRFNGKQAYEAIKAMGAPVKVLFMSGYTADVMSERGILEEGLEFMSKPISPNELLHRIRAILDGA